ncbi:rod shape-determining protein MreD [Pseudomonas sp. KSR10]|jgi:rod shape-determining protein MreD|uniref:Rod shape-determining protein MreD n=1 Tax=Stutzerimonas stutzeri TaxID=316 RepID=A0A0D9AL07_STUST|nr:MULTISPECIES: rod shape-determining protein MreD [Pseudomonadaceae]KJH80076.1 rod shape-determining protein MreD [Stutzerimonas stutzeri]MCG6539949.1 rod shape-determining protein MreD [Pseudomonas sp. KSR10]
MIHGRLNNGWVIWLSMVLALLLSVAPMPASLGLARPLWLGMFIAYWAITLPHRGGMAAAFFFGLMLDVLSGTLLGQNGLPLILITFLVLSLQQRLRMFPLLQQSLVLLVILGLGQLVQLWLNTLTGNRPPTLLFLVPVPVSALLWPWVFVALQWARRRFNVY